MTTPVRVGVVLAGGFGTRFEEGDKTLATLHGRPLLAHAIDGVTPAVDGVVVSCREGQLEEFRPVFDEASIRIAPAPDPEPDRGPAVGLATALDAVGAPVVAVVAADMPFVDAALLEYLFDRVGDADGVVPAVDGHPQSTHGVYRTGPLREAVRRSIEVGEVSLRAVLDDLDLSIVPEAAVLERTQCRTFVDVNTVSDLEEASALLERDDRHDEG